MAGHSRSSRGGRVYWLILLAAAAACATHVAQAQRVGPSEAESREQLYAALRQEVAEFERHGNIVKLVVKLIGPTVVHIETEKIEPQRRSASRRMVEEAGSGVVVALKNSHYILTNWHVIKEADLGNITVELADGRQVNPTRVWGDPSTDIAVMAINATGLVAAAIGDSASVEIGDFVLAVGSPFGLSRSVTYGIVSAKGRRDLELGSEDVKFQDFIQTDAAINPGNSGGPLINLRGEVIGINTAIASNSGGNEGIGFSIPINMVMAIARQLVERGRVVRAFLGVHLDRNFGPSEASRIGLGKPRGALINQVTPNSPAQKADLKAGDVVLNFDGVAIEDDAHLINIVSLTEVGRDVPVVIQRDRQQLTLHVRVADRDQFDQRAQVVAPQASGIPAQSSR
jgi:serine protease Do